MEKFLTSKVTMRIKNIAVVLLYRKMGFQAPGVYRVFDVLSLAMLLNVLMEMEKKLS